MLNCHDRELLTESMIPPAGFELDEALGTTYSLDLLALAAIPLAATGLDAEIIEHPEPSDTLALIETLRRNIHRFTVFCQAGAIQVPREFKDVFLWLEPSVVEVTSPHNNGVFHPKIWLLRFVSQAGEVRYRFLCLTRNLTFDRSWDTVLCLEGALKDRINAYSGNRPLADFVVALGSKELAVSKLNKANSDRIQRIAEDILKVEFEVPDGFSGFKFWPIGINKHYYSVKGIFQATNKSARTPFEDLELNKFAYKQGRQLLVISPFISNGFTDALVESGFHSQIVSRADTLDALNQETLKQLNPSDSDERLWHFSDHDTEASSPLSGLHAKLFLADDGWDSHLWTGSANATDAAFGRNVEFLVQLTGTKSRHGIECLMASSTKEQGGFRDLLSSYVPDVDRVPVDDGKHQRQLDYLAKSLAGGSHISASIDSVGDDLYTLTIRIATEAIASIAGLMPVLKSRPVSLPAHMSKQGISNGLGKVDMCFTGLPLSQLTEFIAIDVELPGTEMLSSAVTRIAINGMPDRKIRQDNVLLQHLKSSDDLMRYLAFMLAEDAKSLAGAVRQQRGKSRSKKHHGGTPHVAIFETMMRGLVSDPKKFDELDVLFSRFIHREGHGNFVSSEAFRQILEPLFQAKKQLRAL